MGRTHKVRDRMKIISDRHATHHTGLRPQTKSERPFKKFVQHVRKSHCEDTAYKKVVVRPRAYSCNYGGLERLLKRAVAVSVCEDGEVIVISTT